MKQHVLGTLLFLVLSAFLILTTTGRAGEYEIVKTVKVGPCSSEPMLGPFKWSPDGSRLAFFGSKSLLLSDTLANSTTITEFSSYPHRFEWVNDNELCLHLQSSFAEDSVLNKLVLFDIENKTTTLLDEFWQYKFFPSRSEPLHEFDGPRVTLEGNLYYTHTTINRASSADGKTNERRLIKADKDASLENNHVLCWGDDGLYRVNLLWADSVRIAPKPYRYIPFTPVLNHDGTLALLGETLIELKDSTAYNYYWKVRPEPDSGVYCGLAYVSFNPRSEEILFQLACDNGDKTIADSIGVYNYLTTEMTIFSPPDGNDRCWTPVYAPDGNKIAFWSDGNLYIMYRRHGEGYE